MVKNRKMLSLEEFEDILSQADGMREAIAEEKAAREAEDTAALRAAEFLKEVRERAGLSQSELAAKLGMTQARISQIENAQSPSGPTFDLLSRIAYACGGELVLAWCPVASENGGSPKGEPARRIEELLSTIRKQLHAVTRTCGLYRGEASAAR